MSSTINDPWLSDGFPRSTNTNSNTSSLMEPDIPHQNPDRALEKAYQLKNRTKNSSTTTQFPPNPLLAPIPKDTDNPALKYNKNPGYIALAWTWIKSIDIPFSPKSWFDSLWLFIKKSLYYIILIIAVCLLIFFILEWFTTILSWIYSLGSNIIWFLSLLFPRFMSSVSLAPNTPTPHLPPVDHVHPLTETLSLPPIQPNPTKTLDHVHVREPVIPAKIEHDLQSNTYTIKNNGIEQEVEIVFVDPVPKETPRIIGTIPGTVKTVTIEDPKESLLRKEAIRYYEEARDKTIEFGRTLHHVFYRYSEFQIKNKTPQQYAAKMELELLKHNEKFPDNQVDCLSSMDILSNHQNHNFPAHFVIRVKDTASRRVVEEAVKLTSTSTIPIASHQKEVRYKYKHILYPTLNVTDFDADTGLPVNQYSYFHTEQNDHCRGEMVNYENVKIVDKHILRWNHLVGFYTDLDGKTQVESFYGYEAACLAHFDDIQKGRWPCTNKALDIPPIPRLIMHV